MRYTDLIRFAFAVLVVSVLAAETSAQPPVHSVPAVRPLGPETRPYNRAPGSFYRFGVPSYSGYGTGMYDSLGYGLGYSPFGYSGLPYGGVGYGPLGYGYGYPSASRGARVMPRTYAMPYPVMPAPQVNPAPVALPAARGEAAPATITVLAPAGAKISFNGAAAEAKDGQFTFTTTPIAPGAETRVRIAVDGPGASTMSVGMRAGEKATIDLRK